MDLLLQSALLSAIELLCPYPIKWELIPQEHKQWLWHHFRSCLSLISVNWTRGDLFTGLQDIYALVQDFSADASFGRTVLFLALPSTSAHPPPTEIRLISHPQWDTIGSITQRRRSYWPVSEMCGVVPICIPLLSLLPLYFRFSLL